MGLFWPMCNTLRADCRLFDPGHCAPPPVAGIAHQSIILRVSRSHGRKPSVAYR